MENCAVEVVVFMKRNGLVLATAESCTCGLIASSVADVPGAGSCLDRAFVTYSVSSKIEMLDVNPTTVERFNLTSVEVAQEMARGALKASRANVAISNTGVVDDTDAAIPAGTQCIAWAFERAGQSGPMVYSEAIRLVGDRHEIRAQCAQYALRRLPEYFRQSQLDMST